MREEMHRRHLFEPALIGRLELKNRLVRSATWEGMCDASGRPGEALADLYRKLARGGTGLIVTGIVFVSPDGRPLPGSMGLWDDEGAQAARSLVAAVHQEGGRICAQLGHAGGQTRAVLCGGRPLAPSELELAQYKPETPEEISPEHIARIIEAFGLAARRARDCGFDAVQLMAGHGYLINQFLSPHTNLRKDGYGGDLEGRSRFLREVYSKVRAQVGTDYPVLVKLNGTDNLEGGLELEEAVEVARQLDALGIDAIEVSGGTPGSGALNPLRSGIDSPEKEGYNLVAARAIKQKVFCPVITVGGIRSYWTARRLVAEGDCDFVALCRPLVREPDLPRRWRYSDEKSLAECISCNNCFRTALKGRIACTAKPV